MATSPQRAYRAACPNCGAPVAFASAASASAVCSFCRSTLVREGDALRRIGVSAELFDDHSPLQLGASGRYQGAAFTLVGRLQYAYADGTWNEWHALFDAGGGVQKSGWLSEDNGAYVIAFDAPLAGEVPDPAELHPGERRLVGGTAWNLASVLHARLLAVEGELPSAPRLDGGEFVVTDWRNERNEVGTLDHTDPARPVWSVGRPVRLAELALGGVRELTGKTLAGEAFACPACGAALEPRLSTTQAIVCQQCKAVVDVSQGVGGDLAHYAQTNSGHDGIGPQIALGSSGRLTLDGRTHDWQVVGYLERCDIPDDSEDEQSFWREYLLYNQTEGFVFLVDSEEGWSWARPLTGAPQLRGDKAQWSGQIYAKRYSYPAKVTWVLGEFYWRVRREERALVTDYVGSGAAAARRLAREQTGNELTWSEGATLGAQELARAFGIKPDGAAALRRDAAPAAGAGVDAGTLKAWLIVAVVGVMLLTSFCSGGDDCDELRASFGASSNEYQQCLRQQRSGSGFGLRGGSFGGFSSGGGHK